MVFIHGIGHFHPDNVIDNQFLEDLKIDISNEWIMERVGIRERRTLLSLDYIRETYNKNPARVNQFIQFSNVQTAAKAAHMAFMRANLSPKDIGMVIAGGSFPQYSTPAQACTIAAELGIEAIALDINSGCSTFAAQIHMINLMQSELLPDYILVVIPDNTTRSVDFSDRRTAVLWGDCTVAIIVSKKIKSKMVISHTMMVSKPADWGKALIPTGGHIYQEGSSVQKFAITTTIEVIDYLRTTSNIDPRKHYFIGHQANLLMLHSACRIAGIAEDYHLYNVDRFGNCAAAGAPSVLSQAWSRFLPDDLIALVVVGAGLTWGGMLIQVT